MISLTIRIIRQMLHDKRSLALILIAPIVILTLLYFVLGKSSYIPSVAVVDMPQPLVTKLEQQDIELIKETKIDDIQQYLKDKKADAVVRINQNLVEITMLEMDSVKGKKITLAFQDISTAKPPQITYVFGNQDASLFDTLGFALLGILSFFFVFIISGISFVRERTNGTLERLMLTPIRRSAVVMGYTFGFGFFVTIQSILIVLFTKFILKMEFAGSWLLAMFIMLLLAFVAVLLGSFVSIFANNEFQVMQFIPIIIVPQIFFSGIIPIETIPYGLSNLAYCMPIYYGTMALKEVLVFGSSIGSILFYFLMLIGFLVLLFFANIFALKKYRVL